MSLVPLENVGLWAMSVKAGPNKGCSVVFASVCEFLDTKGRMSIKVVSWPFEGPAKERCDEVQARPASLDINRTGAFHSQLSTHDLNDSSPSGEM
jgi:hypothetical protein